jgi:hypothetical protein
MRHFSFPHESGHDRFADGSVTRIETPMGPLNARFEKVKDLP